MASKIVFAALMAVLAAGTPAAAEIKVIEAEAVFAIGDSDSKVTARRIAVQEAQRKALELAGVYVSSLTEVRDLQLARDEVTAYTAGIVETEIVQETTQGTAERPVIAILARCRIDTEVLLRQIEEFTTSDELKKQLLAAQKENDALIRERDALLAQLAEENAAGRGAAGTRLESVLAREESNRDVSRVWSAFLRKAGPFDLAMQPRAFSTEELDNASAALDRALALNARNARAQVLRAAVHELKGDAGLAEKQLRAASKAHPANPLYHMALGLLLNRQDRHGEALQRFLAVERLRPREPRVLFHIGMTYKSLGQCRQASSNLKRFLKATEGARASVTAALRESAIATLADCKGMPRGPEGRPQPMRRQR